ncbi:peptidylprolyl isomerase [Flavobacterium columnare]|uniref:PpiC-type peptidyl-prolyl cis-trans isomerase n=2 Tax=Flavobacterium columnare TaxID=996 RepID=G8X7P4_FLACA|nr:peptidylprolyl isomerase [Flavobacterium columnare]AEW85757.1 PpiC-type peptidyl-prolyl cis-trans isomerase [Flavobacterium columnare ATCC 49512]AMO21346.1 peptidylprolyl isomerase [Flavobacterium columnare]ANO47816.1 PpiC-type peptidyl-prolyl cis-trans isomerase [Flavobacterium columnare]APT21585.1 peptidylprolyl isomerase [Flavobacterium columnare]AUX19389.1 peptidylprolyl isomerase [Flavobacterium columnare]
MKLIQKVSVFLTLFIAVFSTTAQKTKVDGVVGVVGDYIILDSDIDKTYIELKQQGINTKEISRCQMLGKLLEDKLYAHQAVQDSIKVTDAEVNQKLEEQLDYAKQQLGSMEKVVEYYRKSSEQDLRTELFDIIKSNKLTAEMQKKIVDLVTITPEEVRDFYKKIPKEELPVFGAEMELAQIVVKPEISKDSKQVIIDQLKSLKKEVLENGASFFTKAVLYSEDPGSKNNGGYYKMNRKTQFVKEFKDVAFSLQEGEISEPFETEFGYHIIQLEKIKGQDLELRHIVIAPKASDKAIKEAREKAEKIRSRILNKELTFAQAARQFSDEKETKNDGGVLLNPKTQDTRFELTKMDPSIYGVVANLKDGEISYPVTDEDRTGAKFFKIMTVTNRFEEHTADYAKDYLRLKELALKEKQLKEIAKWSADKIKETHIKINGEYRDCTFTNNWLKK